MLGEEDGQQRRRRRVLPALPPKEKTTGAPKPVLPTDAATTGGDTDSPADAGDPSLPPLPDDATHDALLEWGESDSDLSVDGCEVAHVDDGTALREAPPDPSYVGGGVRAASAAAAAPGETTSVDVTVASHPLAEGGYAEWCRADALGAMTEEPAEDQGPHDEFIRVFLRVRGGDAVPKPGQSRCVEPSVYRPNAVETKSGQTWEFDGVLDEHARQQQVYDAVARDFVPTIFEGKSAAVMCYGQTGSGKTHSMIGPAEVVDGEVDSASAAESLVLGTDDRTGDCVLSPDAGIAPRVCKDLFAQSRAIGAIVKVSFFEIYCEHVVDLLAVRGADRGGHGRPGSGRPGSSSSALGRRALSIHGGRRGSKHETVYVNNAVSKVVGSAEDALELLRHGMENRVTASTKCNKVSSRGHAIFLLSVSRTHRNKLHVGQFYLCDLAGSEKLKKTEAEGLRLQEASRINTSLLTLRRCIDGLSRGHSRSHVPFRDSKLTRLLQNALGGTGRASILCTVNASMGEEEEALSTLRFAAAASTVSNTVVANVIERTSEEWERLLTEANRTIQRLTSQLSAVGGSVGNPRPVEPPIPAAIAEGDLQCPLTGVLFAVPVVAMDGRTYEKAAILEYFRNFGTAVSPVDGVPLGSDILIPNRCVAVQAARVRRAHSAAKERGLPGFMPTSRPPARGGPARGSRHTVVAARALDTPLTLNELPTVVLATVCRFLAPWDKNAMRATCRRLYIEASSRTVWAEAISLDFGRSDTVTKCLMSAPKLGSPRDEYCYLFQVATHDAALSALLPKRLLKGLQKLRSEMQRKAHERQMFLTQSNGVALLA